MSIDVKTSVWKLDTATQGEGGSMAGTQVVVGSVSPEADDEKFTMVGHGFATGDGPIQITGTIPTGLALLTDYWVIKIDADDFYVAATRALAIAGTNLTYTSDGGSNFITRLPLYPHSIYIKNIVIVGDGANDGTVVVHDGLAGSIIAQAEVLSEATAAGANHVIPIYAHVKGVYLTTLDASNAVVLIYTGR